jgi:hypothetical protein
MKNLKLIALSVLAFVTIASMVFVSCQKAKTTIESPSSNAVKNNRGVEYINFNDNIYSIKSGILTFETFDKYKQLFESTDPNTLQVFADLIEKSKSMLSYTETDLTPDQKDELHILGKLINSDGMIKIDIFTLLLNFKEKIIFATRYGTSQDLLNANNGKIPSNVYKLNMEDEETIDALLEIKTRGLFCKERYATSNSKVSSYMKTNVYSFINPTDNTTKPLHIEAQVRYVQGGIYYELSARSWTEPQYYAGFPYNNPSYNVPRTLTTNYTWKRRCNSASGNGTNVMSNVYSVGSSVSYDSKFVIYNGWGALKNYNVSATLTSTASAIQNDSYIININN